MHNHQIPELVASLQTKDAQIERLESLLAMAGEIAEAAEALAAIKEAIDA